MRNKILSILIVFLMLGFAGCGAELNTGENYGNILTTDQGLILTEAEHTGGWGRAVCTMCHNLDNIHLVDRTGINVDVDAIRTLTLEQGYSVCSTCHGTNGVE